MKIKITKLREADNPRHPNNIAEGWKEIFIWSTAIDILFKDPEIGERFYAGINWSTSCVQEIIDGNTFRTYNSIYKWEIIDEEYDELHKAPTTTPDDKKWLEMDWSYMPTKIIPLFTKTSNGYIVTPVQNETITINLTDMEYEIIHKDNSLIIKTK
jgi:hypothetical protein